MSVETLSPAPSALPAAPSAPQGSAAGAEVARGSGHSHAGGHRPARRVAEVRPSLLRMSLMGRLVLAVVLLVPLWVAVVLVVG